MNLYPLIKPLFCLATVSVLAIACSAPPEAQSDSGNSDSSKSDTIAASATAETETTTDVPTEKAQHEGMEHGTSEHTSTEHAATEQTAEGHSGGVKQEVLRAGNVSIDLMNADNINTLPIGTTELMFAVTDPETGEPLDVENLVVENTMPMEGMEPMTSMVKVEPLETLGQYKVTTHFGMAGIWHLDVAVDHEHTDDDHPHHEGETRFTVEVVP